MRKPVLILAALLILYTSPSLAQSKRIIIKGSDTMVNLGASWAEAYMRKHPEVSISVTGGGSGTGIAAFLNGTCDIAQSSRDMKKKEIDYAQKRGVVPVRTIVAMDGLSVVVHSSNPVKSLTLEQIAGIYTGKSTDWKQLGGKPGRIVVLSRENNSGTHVLFRELVMNDENYRPDALMMPSTKSIQQEISSTPTAIGYGGEAYFKNQKNCKTIPVVGKNGKPIHPTNENVTSGKYPISRPLNFYTPGVPRGAVANFIKFCLSNEGQAIVSKVGYVPLKTK